MPQTQTDQSLIFARWRQCALTCRHWSHLPNTIELVFPSAHQSPQPKRQTVFAQLTADTLQWTPLSPKIVPSHGDLNTHVTHALVLGPMRAHNPNGTRIGSVVFAQMTAEWDARFPLKIAPSHGGPRPHLIHGSLGPPQFSTRTTLSIGSAVFAGLTSATEQPSDGPIDRPQ